MSVSVEQHLYAVLQQIRAAEKKYSRKPHSVSLLAVSKIQPVALIYEAFQAGQRLFGENFIQEAIEKQNALKQLAIEWHFIGSIQSNKTKQIAEHMDWVHSIDRIKIAKRLNDQRPKLLAPLQVCIEVNIDSEKTKSGVLLAELGDVVSAVMECKRLSLRGLMVIPKFHADFFEQKALFDKVGQLQTQLNEKHGLHLDTLSMGMSQDFEAAIAAGSTMVRVGTAIFGKRLK